MDKKILDAARKAIREGRDPPHWSRKLRARRAADKLNAARIDALTPKELSVLKEKL